MRYQALNAVTNGALAQLLRQDPYIMELSDAQLECAIGGRTVQMLSGMAPMELLENYELADLMTNGGTGLADLYTNGGTGLAGLNDLGKFKLKKAFKKIGKVVKKVAKVAIPVAAAGAVGYGAYSLLNPKKKKGAVTVGPVTPAGITPPFVPPLPDGSGDAAVPAVVPAAGGSVIEAAAPILSQGLTAATQVYAANQAAKAQVATAEAGAAANYQSPPFVPPSFPSSAPAYGGGGGGGGGGYESDSAPAAAAAAPSGFDFKKNLPLLAIAGVGLLFVLKKGR